MPSKIDIVGRTFGMVTVLGDGARTAYGRRSARCLCTCGATFDCDARSLLRGDTTSCGCARISAVLVANGKRAKHAAAGTPEYNSWVKIKGRCFNKADAKYAEYGGRGITVCDAWRDDFAAFFADMGTKPAPDASIDRIDVNGPYAPENCRWATPKQQSRNKRNHRFVEYAGRSMSLAEACELSGTNYRSALWRLNAGKHWLPTPTATGEAE